ncbi:hypothetical protein MPSEU_000684600 [Mayamaea pseudoterrestris]|nr:hypothetical protein MPSEU_000684600 [Mayamaea pseudoterrestris]
MTHMTLDASTLSSKRVVYVGGIADQATSDILHAAMLPFGPIKSVELPMDYAKGVHRGFAFTEYEDADDAEEAIFNLNGSELLGRTLKVSLAQPNQVNKLSASNEAVWKSDDWFKKHAGGIGEKTLKEQQDREKEASILHQD